VTRARDAFSEGMLKLGLGLSRKSVFFSDAGLWVHAQNA
jgi:hypothetical protein